MTPQEKEIATALLQCNFLPGSFDKRFVKKLPNWFNREMTTAGKAKMMELLTKYRRQIPNYGNLVSANHQGGLFTHEHAGKGAEFSPDRKYRYVQWRIWKPNIPMICFIGLNPVSADDNTNDATMSRVTRFARTWGYGGVYMLNLFGIVSTNPAVLSVAKDPIGDNDRYLKAYTGMCTDVVFAWGAFPEARTRAKDILDIIHEKPNKLCLGLNKNGSPKHPLYVAAATKPIPYNP